MIKKSKLRNHLSKQILKKQKKLLKKFHEKQNQMITEEYLQNYKNIHQKTP